MQNIGGAHKICSGDCPLPCGISSSFTDSQYVEMPLPLSQVIFGTCKNLVEDKFNVTILVFNCSYIQSKQGQYRFNLYSTLATQSQYKVLYFMH